jgi:DNA-directed RNA polymerase subunit RPC12/RpoP
MAKANDWLYICVDCGHQVTAGVDFHGDCPKCHRSRWLCHWLNKDKAKEDTKNKALPTKMGRNEAMGICHPITSPLRAILKGDTTTPTTPQGMVKTGVKRPAVPDDLIIELASKGYGCKTIAAKLVEQGIVVSYRTIQRRLQGSLI